MQFAREEALRLNHEYIGTEHILLGLLREGSGVVPSLLKKIDHDFRKVRAELDEYVENGAEDVMVGELPFTPEAERVLDYADAEAGTLAHERVAAEHILLGLVRENQAIASKVLLGFGLNVRELRKEIEVILRQPYDE